MCIQFLPHLLNQPNAAIVNVSSGLAYVPTPISPVYCASKAGLHSFTQSLRIQLRSSGVTVFELAPPLTQTALHEIRPGLSNVLKLMSRVAPAFILNRLSKSVDRMLAQD